MGTKSEERKTEPKPTTAQNTHWPRELVLLSYSMEVSYHHESAAGWCSLHCLPCCPTPFVTWSCIASPDPSPFSLPSLFGLRTLWVLLSASDVASRTSYWPLHPLPCFLSLHPVRCGVGLLERAIRSPCSLELPQATGTSTTLFLPYSSTLHVDSLA